MSLTKYMLQVAYNGSHKSVPLFKVSSQQNLVIRSSALEFIRSQVSQQSKLSLKLDSCQTQYCHVFKVGCLFLAQLDWSVDVIFDS